jgi:hypothetical protein
MRCLTAHRGDVCLPMRSPESTSPNQPSPTRKLPSLATYTRPTPPVLTPVDEGFAFLGFEFRKPPRRLLYMWPRKKACQHIRDRVREVVRSFPSSASVDEVIRKLNPILNGWCTYSRAGNSNRIFHQIDWAVLSELQLWLGRKHQCSWRSARKHWDYQFLYKRCRLYQMVGRVSHLPGLRRRPPEKDGRRSGCGKSARPVR